MLTASHYDVLVVGAGPAGAAFARLARKARPGIRIAVLEKYRFPRDKICGDGLTFLTLPLIRAIFPEADLAPLSSPSSRVSVRAPFGRRWYQVSQTVDVIPRRLLDEQLARTLRLDGTELVEEATVTDLLRSADGKVRGVKVRAADGVVHEIQADLVVGADGSSGVVRRKTGSVREDHSIFAIRQYCRKLAPSDDGLVFDLQVADQFGYFWVFPFEKDGERWGNVGYGTFSRSLAQLKRSYEEYLKRPEIARYFEGAELVGKPEAFPINLARMRGHRLAPARASWGPGYVLIGDAAGLVHPYTGEGISFALESARLAADAYFGPGADAARAGARYERRLRASLAPTHQVLVAYVLLRFPTLLPARLRQPFLDGVIGAIRLVRRLKPAFLSRSLFAKRLETLPG